MASGSDSDDEYMADDLYKDFLVSDMFSEEYDLYYEQSVERVAKHFHPDSPERAEEGENDGDVEYECENVVADCLPTSGDAAAGKPEPNLASDHSGSAKSGIHGITISISACGGAGHAGGGEDHLEPLPSPAKNPPALVQRSLSAPYPSSMLRPTGGAEGGPDYVQAHSRSEGYILHRPPNFRAVAQHDKIVLLARELMELGNDINRQYEERMRSIDVQKSSYLVYWRKLTDCIQTVTNAIDATLTWVEHHSKTMMEEVKNMKDRQKQEGVLRGLVLLTDISQRVTSIAVIQMACQYLDAPDEPFEAQRNAVRMSLDEVGSEINNISERVKTASDLLSQIIKLCDSEENHSEFRTITREFDNAVREANVAIRSCDKRLENASENIRSLSFKINSIRWAHRGFRFVGFGLTAYYFYGKYCDGSINKPTALLAGGCSLIGWLAMFPTKTYEYHEQLSELQYKQDEMRQHLESLRVKLHSAKEHKRSVTEL
ncbi:uncharacterized protein LOC135498763 [Lineus longissimus]|uniref:uncharacterized protein LOC135498763 n=1 Tax=Lineus longissimus TaxID=88925 RepID=UPI00315E0315